MSNFTLTHYSATIQKYLLEGYSFTLPNTKLPKKQVILSHDIDMDPSLVSKMSAIEDSVGVKSTYFFRVRSKNYNFFSRGNIALIHDLKARGHGVGLHYEPPPVFDDEKIDYARDIQAILEFLSLNLKFDIQLFNIHEPSRTGIDLSKILVDNNRCYNSPFFEGFKYLSDSGARWREGCFSEHVGKWNKMLVLTHPFWWYWTSPGENY